MFPCETCGHPLNRHNPCSAMVGKGKKERVCGCPAFQPDDLRVRVAALTDHAGDPVTAIAEAVRGGRTA